MNNSYLNNQMVPPIYTNSAMNPGMNNQQSNFDEEQSYVENILRLNRGKKVSIYQSFADAGEWKDRVFTGIIEQSGKDHIILSDPTTGNWYLLLMIYVNFIKFDEFINTKQEFYPTA